MSLKTMPGRGKSGMSRMCARRSSAASPRSPSARDLAQVPHEEQVLEVRGDRGEVLERLDGLPAALRVPRAKRRGEDLLEQRRLAVGRGAEDAEVATAHPEARELGDGPHDLAVGVVVVGLAVALLALDHAEVLELADELRVGVRVV